MRLSLGWSIDFLAMAENRQLAPEAMRNRQRLQHVTLDISGGLAGTNVTGTARKKEPCPGSRTITIEN
jgi:hypothetical protein